MFNTYTVCTGEWRQSDGAGHHAGGPGGLQLPCPQWPGEALHTTRLLVQGEHPRIAMSVLQHISIDFPSPARDTYSTTSASIHKKKTSGNCQEKQASVLHCQYLSFSRYCGHRVPSILGAKMQTPQCSLVN